MAVVDRWKLFKGNFTIYNENLNWDPKIVVAVDKWSYSEVVVSSGLTVLV